MSVGAADPLRLTTDFLSVLSHDLRTPLNGIKTWAYFLDQQLAEADPAVRRAIAGVLMGVDQQAKLIDDLLELTRALNGTLSLVKHPVSLLPLLSEAVEACAQGAMARIEVRDDGAGIATEFLPYVFDPFRQADQGATRRVQQGVGLGLALVQRLAELQGGQVTCASAGEGHGSSFHVFLPLRREAGSRAAAGPSASTVAAMPSLAGIGVLLIDDQRESRESLAALLRQAGAVVRAASSGSEALSILASSPPRDTPEVVVCDIAMPDEDGYAALKRIRAWEASAPEGGVRRPAIAISAYGEREDRLRALSEGFQTYVAKPISPGELMLAIANASRAARR